jgi:hypothetical protein
MVGILDALDLIVTMIIHNTTNQTIVGLPPHTRIACNIAMTKQKGTDALRLTVLHVGCPFCYKLYKRKQLGFNDHFDNTLVTVVIHSEAHI